MFEPKPILFACHSSLAFLTKLGSLLFCIAFADRCVYALTSFDSLPFLGEPNDAKHEFEGVTSLAESGVLFLLPDGVHSVICDARFLSIYQGTQLEYGQAYLPHQRSLAVE